MNDIEFGAIAMGLLGGLALFLYGLEKLTAALKAVAGARLKNLLHSMTTNRFKAVFAGAFITATIQSSSVTTVLVVGFVSAGLLSFSQSIGIIMGAEIGTTMTAQIIAFKVTKYALVLVFVGFALTFVSRAERVRLWGKTLLGLGLIFFGMQMMSDATSPLRSYEPFIDLMQRMDNPALAVLFSAVFTGLIQSSSATTGVVIVLASQGFITLDAGIALVFGANIGTCVTALLASIGKPREAVRAAAVHVVFNTVGVCLWFFFIPVLADLCRHLSPAAVELTGTARLAAETPRQIANAHTIFNVSNTLMWIGFTGPLARLIERLVPDRDLSDVQAKRSYFDDSLLQTPSLALDLVRMQLGRMGADVLAMVREALPATVSGDSDALAALRERDEGVDTRHAAVISYLSRLSLQDLTAVQSRTLSLYISATNYLENIGDMVENNLVEAGSLRLRGELHIGEGTVERITALHGRVAQLVEEAVEALVNRDVVAAAEIMEAEGDVARLVSVAEEHVAARLTAAAPHRLTAFRVESEVIEALRRIYYFAKRVARVVVEAAAPSKETSEMTP